MTPTQAQIEAAAKALFHQTDRTSTEWKILKEDGRLPWYLDAKAALTAAAEVGGGLLYRTSEGLLIKYTDKDLADTEAATIERCAQVADEYAKRYDLDECLEVAAAIRALKDK